MASSPLRLLVITRHSPLPENDGAGAYLHDILAYLARHGVDIEVAWFQPPGAWIARGWHRLPRELHRMYALRLPGALALGRWRFLRWGAWQARLFHAVKSLLRPHFFRRPPAAPVLPVPPAPALPAAAAWVAGPSPAELRFVAERAARFRPHAVLANYCWLTPCFEQTPGARTFVLAHDVISARLARFHPELEAYAHAVEPASPDGERRLLARADLVLAISADDAATFRKPLGLARVLVVPKAAVVSPPAPLGPEPDRCLFVGGANAPNRAGIEWFLHAIWPLVRTARRGATLHIAGAVCHGLRSTAPGVTLLGSVPDLAAEYRAAAAVVVPLLAGTGVKIKLVEAAGYGKACVTTEVGLQGLDFLRPAVACADGAADFAARLAGLLADPAARVALEARARAAVAAHLSPETCYGPLLARLADRA